MNVFVFMAVCFVLRHSRRDAPDADFFLTILRRTLYSA